MAKEGYKINGIYGGGYSSFSPSYGETFTGYHVQAGEVGLSADPRVANVLQEVSSKLSTGVKAIEITPVQPDVFESIPKDHLKELNRLAKLTGIKVSLHGPLIEASGFTREGYSEENREAAERQMTMAIEKAHDINPDGSSPVTFHSSALLPQPVYTIEKGERKPPSEVYGYNAESGAVNRYPLKEREFPGEEGKPDIQKELIKINEEQWMDLIRNMSYYANIGLREISDSEFLARTTDAEIKAGKMITPEEKFAKASFERGSAFLDDAYRQLQSLFEVARRHGSDEDRKILNDFSDTIREKALKIKETKNPYENAKLRREIIDEGVRTFRQVSPEILKPLDDFAREKSTKTFGNVAWNSYKKYKDKAPIISIENPPVGGAFSTGEELKEIVEKSREQFVEKAREEGMSESEAKAAAEKLIGVTWDVGHINMLRKYGYETKEILKETEKVAPFVKHIHLSDNFGFEHTELPMGMGNVPLKEIMEKLGKEGFDAKKIIEAGNWWQHFKTPPVKESFEGLGSPIYTDGVGPYWNQSLGLQQGYFGGYGLMLPQINYETFGAGFSQLPTELGGQRAGAQGSRMSGRPME